MEYLTQDWRRTGEGNFLLRTLWDQLTDEPQIR